MEGMAERALPFTYCALHLVLPDATENDFFTLVGELLGLH